MYTITYHPETPRDLKKITKTNKDRIKRGITEKLMTDPGFYGKPLRKPYLGYLKIRVGDYRVIFRIQQEKVFVLCIMHRKSIYLEALRRI